MKRAIGIVEGLCILGICVWSLWTAVGNFNRWRRVGYEARYIADWRDAARYFAGQEVGLLGEDAEDLTPMDRSRLIAANWELGSHPAGVLTEERLSEGPPHLIVPRYCGEDTTLRLQEAGYEKIRENGCAANWSKERITLREESGTCGTVRELLGGILVLGLVAAGLAYGSNRRMKPGVDLLLAIGIFIILAASVLSHPLLAPNGLGTYAGKAKLWLMAGGVPDGFWTDPRYATYQPSYPPGQTFLSLVVFLLAGGCGDVLVQLFVPLALALLYYVLTDAGMPVMRRLAVLSVVVCPLAQDLSAGYYAEPMAAVLMVVGLRQAEAGRVRLGWLCAGMAGLFRTEGLLLAAGLALCTARGNWRDRMLAVSIAAAPGVMWQVFIRCVGAHLYDYDWWAGPSCERIAAAVHGAFTFSVVEACEIGGVVLLALLFAVREQLERRGTRQLRLLFHGMMMTLLGTLLLGFCTSPEFEWIVEGTLPRYIWLAFIPAMMKGTPARPEALAFAS